MVSLFLSERKACCIILNALESLDVGFIYTKQKRVAVVNARHNETEDEFDSCFSRKVFSDQTNATEVIVAGFSSVRDEVLHGKRGVKVDSKVLCRVGYWDGCVA